MNSRPFLFLVSLALAFSTCADIRTAREMNEAYLKGPNPKIPFAITGLVTRVNQSNIRSLIVRDATGCTPIYSYGAVKPNVGDLIVAIGSQKIDSRLKQWPYTGKVKIIGKGDVPPPTVATPDEILSGRYDYQTVVISGTVIAILEDDVQTDTPLLLIQSGNQFIQVSTSASERLNELVNACVSVTGLYIPHSGDWRPFQGHGVWAKTEDIRIITPAPADPFAVEQLNPTLHGDATEVFKLGRRFVDGTVLAAWSGNRFLLNTRLHRIVEVMLAKGQSLPACGEVIRAVGQPGTDLFNINLSNAIWRHEDSEAIAPNEPEDTSTVHLMPTSDTSYKFLAISHGKVVRLHGLVRGLSLLERNTARLYLESDGRVLPIDISACPDAVRDVEIGCTVEATGVCYMETESWRPNVPLPKIKGFTILVRSPNDIRVLSRPPWWTPRRLMILIGSLLAVLLGFLVWNRVLNRLVVRRSRQLMREELARQSAELRIDERTRLAVELHDSLSQNLSGLACQITAVKKSLPPGADTANAKLDIADRMLASSRTELKRCLWDLRGNTLDCRDMTEAISKTASPTVADAALTVRFNVPRARLTDSLAHAILCITRELASNAVRHGRATRVRIAGTLDNGQILFSVRDNGCGFDVDRHAGSGEGHFGLEGIRERIDRLNGDFTLESSPTSGTVARLRIPLQSDEDSPS